MSMAQSAIYSIDTRWRLAVRPPIPHTHTRTTATSRRRAAAGDGRCIGARVPVGSDARLSGDGLESVQTVEPGPASRASEPAHWSDWPCCIGKCSEVDGSKYATILVDLESRLSLRRSSAK
jgi:hypothetical protein